MVSKVKKGSAPCSQFTLNVGCFVGGLLVVWLSVHIQNRQVIISDPRLLNTAVVGKMFPRLCRVQLSKCFQYHGNHCPKFSAISFDGNIGGHLTTLKK